MSQDNEGKFTGRVFEVREETQKTTEKSCVYLRVIITYLRRLLAAILYSGSPAILFGRYRSGLTLHPHSCHILSSIMFVFI